MFNYIKYYFYKVINWVYPSYDTRVPAIMDNNYNNYLSYEPLLEYDIL